MLRLLPAVCVGLTLIASGCIQNDPETKVFADVTNVTALVADGSSITAGTADGQLGTIDDKGRLQPILNGRVPNGIAGVTRYKDATLFSYVDETLHLVVASARGGTQRVVWKSPETVSAPYGGRLAMSPFDRVLVGVGDMGDRAAIDDRSKPNGKILSLDPNGTTDQQPNVVSSGWMNPVGALYAYGLLWVLDNNGRESRLGRAGDTGFNGEATALDDSGPVGMSKYGDEELVVCSANNGELKRFYLADGVRAQPGRVLADDCKSDVTELGDGRLVYSTGKQLRVTAL